MALKLDLEKAYDYLDWNYVQKVLSKFGFSPRWISLIMECTSCPTKVTKSIDREMRNFFWGNDSSSPPVAWNQGMRWIIGSGKDVKFWTFNWVFDFPLFNLLDNATKAAVDLYESVSDYITFGNWNVQKLASILDQHCLEDCNHLFHSCSFASQIWSLVPKLLSPSRFSNLLDWILHLFDKESCTTIEDCILLCWQIWGARNNFIFNNSLASLNSITLSATSVGYNYRRNNQPASNTASSAIPIMWKPPLVSFFKLNFDGSVKAHDRAAAGFIIRDSNGRPILAGTRKLGVTSVPIAEGSALKDGLLQALRHNITKIQVEGDSLLIINCINKVCATPWRIRSLIADITCLVAKFEAASFSHVFREANFVADLITSMGHDLSNPKIWINSIPTVASTALLLDSASLGCPRGFML
ncbi:uncharacterized protein LOC112203832 [Rosa chinensis]|uniref:uncharacterized protein LOC112203832 n=1 Tax=Rosa chinensis TaxID=74649 RepID=UPI000D08CBC9|nr:uncharacterized protein LOC112203832 [Rosa chinensis]